MQRKAEKTRLLEKGFRFCGVLKVFLVFKVYKAFSFFYTLVYKEELAENYDPRKTSKYTLFSLLHRILLMVTKLKVKIKI